MPQELQLFLDQKILGLPNWKWVSLIAAFLFLFFFRRVVLWLTIKIKKAENYFPEKTFMHFFLEQPIEKGISWVVISGIGLLMINSLDLPVSFNTKLGFVIQLFLAINLLRVAYVAATAFGLTIQVWAKQTESDLDDQLAPFAIKVMKVLVVVVGVLIILQNFGVNVTALLAGLGIGGVALAFAAQDTVSNLFGTVTILLDRPFKLGDWIKVGDIEGTVEELGFRSTRIRTFYNSLITLPNSVMAKEKIDNMTARQGVIRFRHTIGFTYDATPKLLQEFSETLKYHLLQDPSVDRQRIVIHFNSYGDSSLNVLINFHYRLQSLEENEVQRTQAYLNLIHETAAELKLSFAFPTRTVVVQNTGTAAAAQSF